MSDQRHIHDPVLSSLKMEGIRFFYSKGAGCENRSIWNDRCLLPGLHQNRVIAVNRNHVGTWSSHNPQQRLQVRERCPVSFSFVCCSSFSVYVARRVGGISDFDFGKKKDLMTFCSRKTGRLRIFAFRFVCVTSVRQRTSLHHFQSSKQQTNKQTI
jgi:hypothetical protein